MTACVKCGHDPVARVAEAWTFVVEREVRSLNERSTNRGSRATRGAYKRDRMAWGWWMRKQRLELRIPIAKGKRRVTLTRLYGAGCRAFDADNLAGGAKLVVDSMVRETLILNDTPALAEIHYLQERAATPGLRVLLEELA